MDTDAHRLDKITEMVIGCSYTVANALGSGFLEKVDENALAIELRKNGLVVQQQRPIQVRYEGYVVGEYFADLFVENCLVVELKAAKNLDEVHFAQCLNYLKATGIRIALLINFGGRKVQVKRVIHGYESV